LCSSAWCKIIYYEFTISSLKEKGHKSTYLPTYLPTYFGIGKAPLDINAKYA